jgi:tetratricopeptide (TPR) repeat protein
MTRAISKSLVAAVCLLVVGHGGRASTQTGAQAAFQRGLAALHQFEYEDANEAFQQAQGLDPGFVMAYWGEAMTYHQTLWRNENVKAARLTLARLGPTPAARRARTHSENEQAWLGAVERLFGDGDAETRRRTYADAMAQLHARQPDDPDAASLYALALLGTMSRGLIGHVDAHEGHSETLAGSAVQAQVAEILEGVLRSHPEHPGALHYLLHNYDDPEHATLAAAAAQKLATLAPASSHALHMPAHIFFQLGRWHDAARSDRAAFAASDAWVARKRLAAAMRNYHALSWLQYELLQLGRYREARATMDELAPVVKASAGVPNTGPTRGTRAWDPNAVAASGGPGHLGLLSDLSSMHARYVIETSGWPLMAAENNFGNANELFAIGMSAAYGGDATRAERARGGLAERAQDPREGDLRPAIALLELEVAGAIAHAAGRGDEAVRILQAAAEREAQLPPPLGLPAPIKPAPELLGEVLVTLGRPVEAIPLFEQALRRYPNRSLSVLGLARASAAAGNMEAARRHYRALLTNYDQADADLPQLQEARAAATNAPPAVQTARLEPSRYIWWLLGATLVAMTTWAVRALARAKRRDPVARAPHKAAKRRR